MLTTVFLYKRLTDRSLECPIVTSDICVKEIRCTYFHQKTGRKRNNFLFIKTKCRLTLFRKLIYPTLLLINLNLCLLLF